MVKRIMRSPEHPMRVTGYGSLYARSQSGEEPERLILGGVYPLDPYSDCPSHCGSKGTCYCAVHNKGSPNSCRYLCREEE